MDLKNIQVSDLVEKLKGSAELFKDKNFLIKFALFFSSIVIFMIVYYGWVKPIVVKQEQDIVTMNEQKSKITEYKTNTVTLKRTIQKLKPAYEKNSKLFHDKKEVEELYQGISNFAMMNGLTIVNLKKNPAVAVTDTASNNNANQNNATKPPLYYKIPVDFQISGNFLGYLKFRQSLSKSNKHINFDKEKITVVAKNSSGSIISEGTISIVGLPNEFK
jgi:Tfp pilus assembly protein PilO